MINSIIFWLDSWGFYRPKATDETPDNVIQMANMPTTGTVYDTHLKSRRLLLPDDYHNETMNWASLNGHLLVLKHLNEIGETEIDKTACIMDI